MIATKFLFILFSLLITHIYTVEQQHNTPDTQIQPSDSKLSEFTIQVLPSHQILIKSVTDEYSSIQHELQYYICHTMKSNNCAYLARNQAEYNQHKQLFTRNIGTVIENTIKEFKLTPDTPKSTKLQRKPTPPSNTVSSDTGSSGDTAAVVETQIYEFDLTDEDNLDQLFEKMKKQLQQALSKKSTNNNILRTDNTNDITKIQQNNHVDIDNNVEVHVETYSIVIDDDTELSDINQHVLNKLLNKQKNKQNDDNDENDSDDTNIVAEELEANILRVP